MEVAIRCSRNARRSPPRPPRQLGGCAGPFGVTSGGPDPAAAARFAARALGMIATQRLMSAALLVAPLIERHDVFLAYACPPSPWPYRKKAAILRSRSGLALAPMIPLTIDVALNARPRARECRSRGDPATVAGRGPYSARLSHLQVQEARGLSGIAPSGPRCRSAPVRGPGPSSMTFERHRQVRRPGQPRPCSLVFTSSAHPLPAR